MKARLAELSAARGAIMSTRTIPAAASSVPAHWRPALVRRRGPRPRGHRGRWHPRPRRRAAPAGRGGVVCRASRCSTTSSRQRSGHTSPARRARRSPTRSATSTVSPTGSQTVGTWGGVTFVNDSMATIPVAAEAALAAFAGRGVVLVAGGQGKGLAFDAVADAIAARCRTAILIGEVADELEAAIAGRVPVVRASSMDEAVRAAAAAAAPGDIVLLAPAAASFDMFTDYAARGDAFAVAAAGHRPVPGTGLDDRPGRRRARPRAFARRRAPRAWTGVVPAHAGRPRAGGDRRRDGVLRVERAGVSRQRRSCRPGAPAGAVGGVGDRLSLPVQPASTSASFATSRCRPTSSA